MTSKRRESHQQALRQLLDKWCIDRPDREELIEAMIKISDRFHPTPATPEDD